MEKLPKSGTTASVLDQSIHVRFWPKVKIVAKGCWEWQACKDTKGYGMFRIYYGKSMEHAHRTSWRLTNGDIPKGMMVLHVCDNPCCVRPDHLWLGDNNDNMKDMVSKGRQGDVSGEKNGRSILTVSDVRSIRKMRDKQHRSYEYIANRFKISKVQSRKVATGKAWMSVDD